MPSETVSEDKKACTKDSIIKDDFVVKCNCIKGANILAKHNNPLTGMKHTTVEWRDAWFKD